MIIKLGENKSQIVNNETVNGIMVDVYLLHGTANTAFLSSAFVPSEVQVKVELKRTKGNLTVIQDNLQFLGMFSSKDYGNKEWTVGTVLTYPSGGVKSSKVYSLWIPFGGPINLKGSDELVISMIAGRSIFSSAVDSAISYVDFNYSTCIGYEVATPFIRSQVVQANISNEKYSLGDNVIKIMMCNYDKDVVDEASQVVSNLSILSDKLSATYNWLQLFNRDKNCFTPPHVSLRYGNTQPVTAGNEAFPYIPRNPQTFTVFASPDYKKSALNNCQLNVSYNTTNVNASQNFVGWIGFIQDAEIVEKAQGMAEKHIIENVTKIVDSSPSPVTPK